METIDQEREISPSYSKDISPHIAPKTQSLVHPKAKHLGFERKLHNIPGSFPLKMLL